MRFLARLKQRVVSFFSFSNSSLSYFASRAVRCSVSRATVTGGGHASRVV